MGISQRLLYAGGCFFVLARGVILTTIIVLLIHFFVATIFVIDGPSMEPNFHSGQVVLVNRFTYQFGTPQRGEVAILRFPGDPETRKFIKRIVAIPHETVDLKENKLFVGSKQLKEEYLPLDQITPIMVPGKEHWDLTGDDEYFLAGDNRPNSNDSRTFDEVQKKFLIGKAVFILWPPKDAGLVVHATY